MNHSNMFKLFVVFALAVVLLLPPVAARAEGFLFGTWIVRCDNGHDDKVEDITRNHDCEHDGCGKKSVDKGRAKVVCPDNHATQVEGVTRQHACDFKYPDGHICGKQCLRG